MMGDAASRDLVALSKQLASTNAEQRAAAAEQLSQAGEDAAAAAVPLVAACGDADDRVREFAVAALEDLGPPLAADIPTLIPAILRPATLRARTPLRDPRRTRPRIQSPLRAPATQGGQLGRARPRPRVHAARGERRRRPHAV